MLTAAEISPLQPYERTYVPGSELSPQSAFRGRQRAMEWHGFCHCNNSTHGAKICGRRDGEMRNPFAAVFVKGTLNWSKGSSRFLASGWGGVFFGALGNRPYFCLDGHYGRTRSSNEGRFSLGWLQAGTGGRMPGQVGRLESQHRRHPCYGTVFSDSTAEPLTDTLAFQSAAWSTDANSGAWTATRHLLSTSSTHPPYDSYRESESACARSAGTAGFLLNCSR